MAAPLVAHGIPSQRAWGLQFGRQAVALGAGGPLSGMPGGDFSDSAEAGKPWPYATGFQNFLPPGRYGAASTLDRRPVMPNWFTGAPAFNPVGYVKPQTYTAIVF